MRGESLQTAKSRELKYHETERDMTEIQMWEPVGKSENASKRGWNTKTSREGIYNEQTWEASKQKHCEPNVKQKSSIQLRTLEPKLNDIQLP